MPVSINSRFVALRVFFVLFADVRVPLAALRVLLAALRVVLLPVVFFAALYVVFLAIEFSCRSEVQERCPGSVTGAMR